MKEIRLIQKNKLIGSRKFSTNGEIFAIKIYQGTLFQGSVVQSIVSLTSLSVVKILIVLVSTISNSQVFLLKKEFSAKIIAHMPYLKV